MGQRKTVRLGIRCSPEERDAWLESAIARGFCFNQKKGNMSQFVRWVMEHEQKPLDRERYDEFIRINQDYARLGSLFNQYVFHLNREYKILVDKGLEHENNRNLVEGIHEAIERFEPLADLTYELQSLLLHILKREA